MGTNRKDFVRDFGQARGISIHFGANAQELAEDLAIDRRHRKRQRTVIANLTRLSMFVTHERLPFEEWPRGRWPFMFRHQMIRSLKEVQEKSYGMTVAAEEVDWARY